MRAAGRRLPGVRVVPAARRRAITVAELAGVFSQARHREQVESTAREAIALMLDIGESDVGAIEVELVGQARITAFHPPG